MWFGSKWLLGEIKTDYKKILLKRLGLVYSLLKYDYSSSTKGSVKKSDYKIIPGKEHIKVGKSFTNTYGACYIMILRQS